MNSLLQILSFIGGKEKITWHFKLRTWFFRGQRVKIEENGGSRNFCSKYVPVKTEEVI